jgi:hypothetical protein
MIVTEGLMEVGEFGIDLHPEATKSVRDEVRDATLSLDGFIAVFDAPTSVPTLEAALYVGKLTQRTGRYSFRGTGLAGILQDNNNLGKHVTTNTAYASQSLSDWYSDLLPFGGITKGTVTTTGLSSVAATWYMGLGLREMIDFVTSSAGAVWTINTEGEMSAAAPGTLFGDTPSVIVMPDPTTELGGDLAGVQGEVVGLLEDASQVTKRMIGYGAGTSDSIEVSTSTNSGTLARGLDGNALQIDRTIDLANSEGSELTALTAAAAGRYDEPRRAFMVRTNSSSIRSRVAPGDPEYVYDLDADIVGDDLVTFAGQPIRPLLVRVQRIIWNTHRGQGVWLYRPNESNPWTDLTNSVPERDGADTALAEWYVSTDLGAADLIKTVSPDRVTVQRPDAPLVDPSAGWGNPGTGTAEWEVLEMGEIIDRERNNEPGDGPTTAEKIEMTREQGNGIR